MKSTALAFLLVATSALAGAPGPVGPDIRTSLQSWSSSKENRDLKALPASVVKLCADSEGRFAAAGDDWESTDVITGNKPRARLIWYVRKENQFLVHFETGGYAHSYYFLSAETQGSSARVMWKASTFEAQPTFQVLLKTLEQNKVYSVSGV